jgi:Na+-transporting methylmalonyl-CoA/oxaloacetate decarboxylase gamma subunit
MDGLTLSLLGILTTFLALGLFIFSMFFLRWVFPAEKRRRPVLQVPVTAPVAVEPPADGDAVEEEALAAAIAAA